MSEAKPAHVERMEAELSELHDMIAKLESFVADSAIYRGLDIIDQTLLNVQGDAMRSYARTLSQRIERA